MKITQIRNATVVLSYKNQHVLVDPMLADKAGLPRLRYFGGSGRNPLVDLPNEFSLLAPIINGCLITHCQKGHFDHLDGKGRAFLKSKNIPVFAHDKDEAFLKKAGMDVIPLKKNAQNSFFDGTIELVSARHGIGGISFLMEHGVGYFIRLPHTPSLYIMGDTVLTEEIRQFILERQPDYIIAPTGMAQFDIGGAILLSEKEIIELSKLSRGMIIANHMDALDHCRITRTQLKSLISQHGLSNILIPSDGEAVRF